MLNIVVIGDSIAKGLGSTDMETKSYGALIAQKVGGKVTNLGITGLDSSQLIEKLQTEKFQEALDDADVIFVSIGSNDLLKPFLQIVADAAGAEGEGKEIYVNLQKRMSYLSKKAPLEAGNALATAVKNVKKSKVLKQACKDFPKNFDNIITELRQSYPDALIYVNNVYNPYYGVYYEYQGLTLLNIHDLCETYITDLNKSFDKNSKDYKLMDMYSIFRQDGLTNVNPASIEDMSGVSFDPHPNDAGYRLMADYIYTQMDSIAPKVELLLENQDEIPVDMENITLQFSENVHSVEGKEIYLLSKKEQYTYTFTGTEKIEQSEKSEESNHTYELTLSLEDFEGADGQLSYDEDYRLVLEEGAIKDKGNNSPDELEIAAFHTQKQSKAELEANSVTVVNQSNSAQNEKMAHNIMTISAVIFVGIALLIALLKHIGAKK